MTSLTWPDLSIGLLSPITSTLGLLSWVLSNPG